MLMICMTLIWLGWVIAGGLKIYQINKIRSKINHSYTQEIEDKKQIKKKFKDIAWLTIALIFSAILINFIHYLITGSTK